MTFRLVALSSPAACMALRRGRKKLHARVIALLAMPDAEFAHRFPGMVAAVEAGFRHEEALLELLGDACLPPRRADHAIILSALHRTASRVESGDLRQGRQVVDALRHVLELPWPFIGPASLPRYTAAAARPVPR